MKKIVISSLLISSMALLTGCFDSGPKSYLKIAGGGLQFNYRVSEMSMVVIAQQVSPLPAGSIVEAQFDIPGTQTRESVTLPSMEGKLTYRLQSQKLFNIKKGGEYKVSLLLRDKSGAEIDREETAFHSDVDQSTLPDKPLVDDLAFTPNFQNIK
ncbi:hypothetical protein [Aestuariivirga litoralis]|uniref:hypothetical protein n=1 Tax=Aestuariivirga litoralis TaxID=2650924 RepID=UPI0018C5EFBE|nr:hypothetical protein [Aestuariivirga litoralis]MBG1233740.1 hypothetical protein [Aestuariivirga litoralis]